MGIIFFTTVKIKIDQDKFFSKGLEKPFDDAYNFWLNQYSSKVF